MSSSDIHPPVTDLVMYWFFTSGSIQIFSSARSIQTSTRQLLISTIICSRFVLAWTLHLNVLTTIVQVYSVIHRPITDMLCTYSLCSRSFRYPADSSRFPPPPNIQYHPDLLRGSAIIYRSGNQPVAWGELRWTSFRSRCVQFFIFSLHTCPYVQTPSLVVFG